MKTRARFYQYVLATLVLVLLLGWAGRITWQELRQLHLSFDTTQEDAYHVSDYIASAFDDLSDRVQDFDLKGHPEDRVAFEKMVQDLRDWMHAHEGAPTTPEELQLMVPIEGKIELYATMAAKRMDHRGQAGTESSPVPTMEQMDKQAASIVELCRKLRSAERTEQIQFIKDSRGALIWLQELLALQMGLLIVITLTAVAAVNRGVIGPLRVELGKSRAVAARNEKLASLGTLAAGVAHEIRNPLTAINVRLHSLKKHLVAGSSEQEDALVIGHEIQRLEHIVHDFLMFARPADPRFLTVSADSLLARVQTLFQPQLDHTPVKLSLESVPDIWVRVDPHQIEQVLINLVQNAAESMEHGGTIILRARSGTSRLAGRGRAVVTLEVSDTGTGIRPEVRKRIFDPFFTTKPEGTGLGLAIGARIIEKHGGSIECHSEVNHGTTFSILLPQAKPEATNELPD